jgi:2-hydroxychromene-2-carboxylate isomerase
MNAEPPVFFYDLYSPYAYLAALRVDSVLPVAPRWEPIFFGVVLREANKIPWSLRPGEREEGQADVSRRARERGLPELRWPPGWPRDSYAVAPLRAVVYAGQQDVAAGKAMAMALYEKVFVEGRALNDLEVLPEAASSCGLDADAVREGIEQDAVKSALRASTDAAIARGVTGIPTVAVGEELYWGDDRLEEAAAALAG